MHIHGISGSQLAALAPAQSAQQAMAARKAAAEARRKLAGFASAAGADAVGYVEAYTPGDRGRRHNPQEQESFRSVFVSIKI